MLVTLLYPIFDLSNQNNMNVYTAYYTDNKTKRKIQLPITAIDYAAALVAARELTKTYDYRFDDLSWKKYVKKSK